MQAYVEGTYMFSACLGSKKFYRKACILQKCWTLACIVLSYWKLEEVAKARICGNIPYANHLV